MAVVINGNGTVTGISVGGLPDGIVDTDMLAANAVTAAKANPGLGKVIQTVHAETNTRTSCTSGSYIDTTLTANITPSSASNKVFIMVTSDYYVNSGTGGAVSIFRGSKNLGHSTNGFGVVDGGPKGGILSIIVEDAPSSTSQQTYTLKSIRVNGSNSFDIPRDPSKEPALMSLFEVAP